MVFLFNWVIFRFQANLPGCSWLHFDAFLSHISKCNPGAVEQWEDKTWRSKLHTCNSGEWHTVATISFCKTKTNTKNCATTASDYIEMNMFFFALVWPNIVPVISRSQSGTNMNFMLYNIGVRGYAFPSLCRNILVCSKADWRHGALSTTATLIKLASSYDGTSDANIIWICVSLTMMPPPTFFTYSCTLCLCKAKPMQKPSKTSAFCGISGLTAELDSNGKGCTNFVRPTTTEQSAWSMHSHGLWQNKTFWIISSWSTNRKSHEALSSMMLETSNWTPVPFVTKFNAL